MLNPNTWDSPGGPVAKTPTPNAGVPGSILGRGTRSHMLKLTWHGKIKKKIQLIPNVMVLGDLWGDEVTP